MAQQQLRRKSPSNLGVSPTNAQKLIYIANKLGLSGIAGMQGSTVNLVDTVAIPTSANRQTLSFFTQTQNKSRNFSNFQNGSLNAGEAMIIERVDFFLLTVTGTNFTSDTTGIIDITPISQLSVANGAFTQPGALKTGLMNIIIANQKVVKDYQVFEQDPNFNPQTSGIALTSHATATASTLISHGYNGIVLESPPVLPPNQKIELSLEIPPIGTAAASVAIMCVIGRFGSIFSSKTTL